jgi:diguanylate cyclase (GGDEF)-like protein
MAALLIVEPASPERDRLLELLAAAGHHLTLARDGGEALALWRREKHDLIIADEASGALELAQKIKAEAGQRFVPVLAVVARADARAAALALVEDAVARPLDPGEAAARVAALLRTRKLVEELRQAQKESEARSLADAATGLRNRVFLNERLNEEWKRASRYNEPLSLLLVSIEGLTGRAEPFRDQALHMVAAATLRSLRQIDVVTRFAVNELAALLPNTHFAGSMICADRLYREVARSGAAPELGDWHPVVSMGIAFYPGKDVQEPTDLIKLAARALERARDEGPGSICLVQHQGYLFHPKKA